MFPTAISSTSFESGTHKITGVSQLLDSPNALEYRLTSHFITENFGVMKLENFNKDKHADEEEIPVWHFKSRMKKLFSDTEALGEKLAHIPDAEQYALAAKLTECEHKAGENVDVQKLTKTLVPIDLLRELQFLNRDNNSILKAISRMTTNGGDIAMTALVAKCNDNLDVIKKRRSFVKTLIENPVLLNKLQDHLETIKKSEPLLFSNYRQFNREQLKAFVKGGITKSIVKYFSNGSHKWEQRATNFELVGKPALLGAINIVVSLASLLNLFSTYFEFKNSLIFLNFRQDPPMSQLGATIKTSVEILDKVPWFLFGDIVKQFKRPFDFLIDSNAWETFFEKDLQTDTKFKVPLQQLKTQWAAKQPSMFLPHHYLKCDPNNYIKQGGKIWNKSSNPLSGILNVLNPLMYNYRKKSLHEKLHKWYEAHYNDKSGKNPNFFKTNDADKAALDTLLGQKVKDVLQKRGYQTKSNVQLSNLYEATKTYLGDTHKDKREKVLYNRLAVIGLLVFLTIYMAPMIEMNMKNYLNNYLALKNLFNSVQAPYNTYNAAKNMHSLLAENPKTADLYPTFIPSTSKNWLSFLELVQSNTFHSSFGVGGMLFKDHGKVVQAYNFLMQSQDEIGELIRFYGEIDAYVSMAKLVQEFEDSSNNQGAPTRYSFVEFVEKSKYPRFEAVHYWNPIFAAQRAIPNIINIGENGKARNIMVTGANAGGKSGNIKAILTNIILAQTFGIAPSENLIMTPFSFIQATLKSNDDTANNKSRFQVEALDMARVMQRVLELPKDKFCAIFSDELFAGTEVEPAISLTRRICLSIAEMNNVMYILATHYKELTKLETITNGVFKNYKVEVIKLPDGSLHRPYKLIEGIGGTNIAFDVFLEQLGELGMKKGFLYDMVQKAKDDQTTFELSNPTKTLGNQAFFTNRKLEEC